TAEKPAQSLALDAKLATSEMNFDQRHRSRRPLRLAPMQKFQDRPPADRSLSFIERRRLQLLLPSGKRIRPAVIGGVRNGHNLASKSSAGRKTKLGVYLISG